VILNQQVKDQMAYLTAKTEQLTAGMVKVQRFYMEVKSYMGGICATPYRRSIPTKTRLLSFSNSSILDELYLN